MGMDSIPTQTNSGLPGAFGGYNPSGPLGGDLLGTGAVGQN